MDHEIQRLKKELDHAKKALVKWQSLIQKREELEGQIEKMQKESDHKSYHKKLTEQLSLLKFHLRELDTLLDHLEEHSPEKIEQLEEQLITRICVSYAEQSVEFDAIQNSLEVAEREINKLQLLHKSLKNVQQLLQETLTTRQRVRSLGIFSYIFGVNPNATISQNLHAINELIAFIVPLMKETETDREFSNFLRELQHECKHPWGFRKIDTYFLQALEVLTRFLASFDDQLESAQASFNIIKQKKEDWINSRSRS